MAYRIKHCTKEELTSMLEKIAERVTTPPKSPKRVQDSPSSFEGLSLLLCQREGYGWEIIATLLPNDVSFHPYQDLQILPAQLLGEGYEQEDFREVLRHFFFHSNFKHTDLRGILYTCSFPTDKGIREHVKLQLSRGFEMQEEPTEVHAGGVRYESVPTGFYTLRVRGHYLLEKDMFNAAGISFDDERVKRCATPAPDVGKVLGVLGASAAVCPPLAYTICLGVILMRLGILKEA